MGKETITVTGFAWNLFKALHYVIKEATRIAKGEKARTKGKKRGNGPKRAFAVRLRSGEFAPGKPVK